MQINQRVEAKRGFFVAAILLFFLTACSTMERRTPPSRSTPPPVANKDDFPVVPEPTKEITPPPPVSSVPKKVGLILGPGGAKALAHAGVLKELSRARLPIHSVVGLEWGALAGSLFASRGQAHEMEWKLYKLERQSLPGKGFLSSRLKPESIASLRSYLQESFSRQDLAKAQVGFSCPTQTLEVSEFRWAEQGELASEVENCLAFPPLFVTDKGRWAAPGAAVAAVEKLKSMGVDFIILINVLNAGPLMDPRQLPDSGASAILWQEVRRAVRAAAPRVNEWIEVNTAQVDLSDFSKRKELVQAGEKAGQTAAKWLASKYGF